MTSERFGRWTGVILQATVLGLLLAIALTRILAFGTAERTFRYQGF
jgi:hypothetical protein